MDMFGSGYAFTLGNQDSLGNALANGPRNILGINQDISFDASFTIKELYGQQQVAEDVARGSLKLSGKIKFAAVFGSIMDSVFWGQPNNLVAGTQTIVNAATSAIAIPAGLIVTVAPSLGGVWTADTCVINATTGIPMVNAGTAAPTAGQYTAAAGVYTFNTADRTSGYSVYINYQYTATVTGAYTQAIDSLPMGATPFFSLSHTVPHNGKNLTLLFPSVTSSKLSLALKNEDFLIQEIDFTPRRDPVSGKLMTWSTSV